jgi:hypothetical protein
VVVRETSNVSLIVDFFHKNARDGHLPPAFARVIPVLYEHQQVVIYGAFAGNELVSATVFARNFSNYVNLYSVTSRRGRDLSANYLVINTFIKNHRAPGMYLDFEGSSIPGVEKYFAGFGGTRLAYPHVRLLNLPFIHQRIW